MRRKKQNGKTVRRRDQLVEQIKQKRVAFTIYLILRAIVIAVMILQFFNGNYENVLLCGLTLVLFILPSFVEKNFHIQLPDTLETIILLFIFAAEILGEISAFYVIFPYWDTILHTLNGFLAAAIGFCLVDLLNRNKNLTFKLSPVFMAVVAFCFSMTIGVLWEFFEFAMDTFFCLDMQKDTVISTISSVTLNGSDNLPIMITGITDVAVNGQSLNLGGYLDIGLIDTMQDLLVNFIGAAVFSTIGFFYVKQRGNHSFARRFIPKVLQDSLPDPQNYDTNDDSEG